MSRLESVTVSIIKSSYMFFMDESQGSEEILPSSEPVEAPAEPAVEEEPKGEEVTS